MLLSLLGPVELRSEAGDLIAVASRRQRQLLVALALEGGSIVSVDRLSERLWGDQLPADPVASVQTNISRLRRLLPEPIELTTEAGGYRLRLADDDLDLAVFEGLLRRCRSASGDELIDLTGAALDLWRNVPFPEVDHPEVNTARARFEGLRLEVVDRRIDALSAAGRHNEVVVLAETHVSNHPTRERPVARLMESLFATGRQSEALDRYRRLRDELIRELGVDPSAELQELELAILRQDLVVAPAAPTSAPSTPSPVPPPTESSSSSLDPDDERLAQHIRFCTTSDGVRLAYATSGVGPPLVRAANWMTHLDYDWDSPVWRHWLRGLSQEHRLVRYDERGCGLSDWNVDDFTFDDWIADLETIVDELELEQFPLLGVSQGAAVAIAYACRHPDRVSRLVLVGGYAQGRLARASSDAARAEAAVHVELARVGWGTDDSAFRQVFTSHFLPDGSRELWAEFNELQRRTTSAENATRFMEVFGTIDVVDLAPEVQCPTLVVHSRDEMRVPASCATELAALIPDSELCLLPSRNHLLLEDEAAWPAFLDEVSKFLRV